MCLRVLKFKARADRGWDCDVHFESIFGDNYDSSRTQSKAPSLGKRQDYSSDAHHDVLFAIFSLHLLRNRQHSRPDLLYRTGVPNTAS